MVVIGGQQLTVEVVIAKLDRAKARGRDGVISVQAEPWEVGEDRESVLTRASTGLPHGKVRTADAQALLDNGFTLELDTSNGQNPNHYNLGIGGDATAEDIMRLIACFGEPEPNLGRGH
ncbi:hypothetical protein [Rhodococcus sp. IEGM 1330]|uniref:hypothetical protein n=1 Tax=Rhodococcus sp. IEGM 1330 TaxID=3082225 RepID=UPI00295373D1|nr:hypothetical protein [Rhodococcus sp. IEGM 1330]MDV8021994.1 hypothetical protein [Rhodococcus sp. IEGM 1330]